MLKTNYLTSCPANSISANPRPEFLRESGTKTVTFGHTSEEELLISLSMILRCASDELSSDRSELKHASRRIMDDVFLVGIRFGDDQLEELVPFDIELLRLLILSLLSKMSFKFS